MGLKTLPIFFTIYKSCYILPLSIYLPQHPILLILNVFFFWLSNNSLLEAHPWQYFHYTNYFILTIIWYTFLSFFFLLQFIQSHTHKCKYAIFICPYHDLPILQWFISKFYRNWIYPPQPNNFCFNFFFFFTIIFIYNIYFLPFLHFSSSFFLHY